MPVLDKCHPQVVRALEKAGWRVDSRPLTLETPINNLFIDLRAQRQSDDDITEILIVEVKCFPDGSSSQHELYVAIGQYLIYRSLLRKLNLDHLLYLAIPSTAYHGIVKIIGMDVISETIIKMVIIRLDEEEIEEWINQ